MPFNATRRQMLAIAAGTSLGPTSCQPDVKHDLGTVDVPSYLKEYAATYRKDPNKASLEWFRSARFGLFIHYGLYSAPGGGWNGRQVFSRTDPTRPVSEWLQFHAVIPPSEYAKLATDFTARAFNADELTDLAVAARMKYINITSRHHDGFCLFRTKQTHFNSTLTPARRDLIAELADACQRKRLGMFLYYSHGRDWRHPHAPPPSWSSSARPPYGKLPREYVPYQTIDLGRYVEFVRSQIAELLTQYGPIAGIWLDGEGVLKSHAAHVEGGVGRVSEMMRLSELYKSIREIQPQCLVSYKQGVTGEEDFLTPEHESHGLERSGKPMEICTTLQSHTWGYNKYHPYRKSASDVWRILEEARQVPANVLMNIGPKGDGSVVIEEKKALLAVGQKL